MLPRVPWRSLAMAHCRAAGLSELYDELLLVCRIVAGAALPLNFLQQGSAMRASLIRPTARQIQSMLQDLGASLATPKASANKARIGRPRALRTTRHTAG